MKPALSAEKRMPTNHNRSFHFCLRMAEKECTILFSIGTLSKSLEAVILTALLHERN